MLFRAQPKLSYFCNNVSQCHKIARIAADTFTRRTYPYVSIAQPSRRNVSPIAPLKDKPTSAKTRHQ